MRSTDNPSEEFAERICEYMIKALREAKRHSSWLNANRAWEEAVGHFVRQALHPARGARFIGGLPRARRAGGAERDVEQPGADAHSKDL